MYKRLLTAALLFGMASTGPPAAAAMACAPRGKLVEKLNERYAETLTAIGLQNAGSLVEVFASAETGSFTVLVSRPNGVSCVVSTGTHWRTQSPAPKPKGMAG